ncbi:unnamed protein product, partial [Hydatigera taeniaeformis]
MNATFISVSEQVKEGIGHARPLIYAAVYTPTIILLGILLAYLSIAILHVLEARKTQLFYLDESAAITSSHVCSSRGNLIHAVFFIVFLTITSIFIIVFLPICILFINNGCAYLTDQHGVAQSDYVINSFIASQLWPPLVKQIHNSINNPTTEFLVLPPPKNIINASTVLCGRAMRSARMGFLGAVGWTSFINVSAFLSSEGATNKFIEGEKVLKDEIIQLNLASLIPKDLDKLWKTTQNLTQYFDNIDYQPSIDELSPSRLPLQALTSFADDLEDLLKKIRQLGLA